MFNDFFASDFCTEDGLWDHKSAELEDYNCKNDFYCCCCCGFVFVVAFVCLFFMLAISIDAFRKVRDKTVKMSKCGGLKAAGN